MTTDTQQPKANESKQPVPFGMRLKSAREAMGIDRKEAAQKLHLSEKVILMMEKDRYPIDLPVTFIKGYLRAYGKLLQIPEYEVKKAIEPIKPKATPNVNVASTKNFQPVSNHNYFMQSFTFIILLTMVALVSMWWYTHSSSPTAMLAPSSEMNQALSSGSNNPAAPPGVSAPSAAPAATDEMTTTDRNTQDAREATAATDDHNTKTSNAEGADSHPRHAANDVDAWADETKAKITDNDNDSDYSDYDIPE